MSVPGFKKIVPGAPLSSNGGWGRSGWFRINCILSTMGPAHPHMRAGLLASLGETNLIGLGPPSVVIGGPCEGNQYSTPLRGSCESQGPP